MTQVDTSRLKTELRSFQDLWKGGYYEGDPLDPAASSGYGGLGYMSVLHATYLTCIKPYVTDRSVVLEIGPGRGGWTKTFLKAAEIWCMDALSAEYNHFWEYLGHPGNVNYFQVSDFSCSMLPENKFDYFFSFGCLCHVSFMGITEYMKNLYPKLKDGAECFIMVADYDKYNRALDCFDSLSISRAFAHGKRNMLLRWAWKISNADHNIKQRKNINENDTPSPGRWYHAGVDRTCSMLEGFGYKIVQRDMEVIHRDPVIHFTK